MVRIVITYQRDHLSHSIPSSTICISTMQHHSSKPTTPSSSGDSQTSSPAASSPFATTSTEDPPGPPKRSGWASKNISTLPMEPADGKTALQWQNTSTSTARDATGTAKR
ncbi:hypothetical protein O988_09712 [Pseudogymnoascus sp. VKM F-3808]|nr:hypothetical protein O988_09712 [Pseudogymnoascus sp. VKM F-3808]